MKKILLVIMILFLLSSCSSFNEPVFDEVENKEENIQIVVYIRGEVNLPGVYMINKKSILNDLIRKAGGFTDYADISSINLAKELSNNEMIIIPKINNDVSNKNLININTATLEELAKLPGFGQTRARDVIEYRKNHGPFFSIVDIKKVNGIKDGTFEKIKDFITV